MTRTEATRIVLRLNIKRLDKMILIAIIINGPLSARELVSAMGLSSDGRIRHNIPNMVRSGYLFKGNKFKLYLGPKLLEVINDRLREAPVVAVEQGRSGEDIAQIE